MSKLKSQTMTGKKIGSKLVKLDVLEIVKSQKLVSKASLESKKYISLSDDQETEE